MVCHGMSWSQVFGVELKHCDILWPSFPMGLGNFRSNPSANSDGETSVSSWAGSHRMTQIASWRKFEAHRRRKGHCGHFGPFGHFAFAIFKGSVRFRRSVVCRLIVFDPLLTVLEPCEDGNQRIRTLKLGQHQLACRTLSNTVKP